MNQHFLTFWQRTRREEGGFVNNPKDSGRATNHGITERTARAAGFTGDMRDLTREQARQIAKAAYWDPLRLDDIAALSPAVADELFDTGFLCGLGNAGRFLQRCLNVGNRGGTIYADMAVDGVIGPVTVAALRDLLARRPRADEFLMKALNCLQGEYFIRISESRPDNEEFVLGWMTNRVKLTSSGDS